MNKAEKTETTYDLAPDRVVRLPIDLIDPDFDQPRTDFPEASLNQLAEDIKRRGIEQPILVRAAAGGRYQIKHGERRWRAARRAGLETVPALLAGPDDAAHPELERAIDQVLDNQLAEKLAPMDMARFLRKLVDVHGLAVKDLPAELAKRGITMSRPYVSNLMRLVDLPDWAARLLNQGKLTASDAKHILMARPWPPAMQILEKEYADAADGDEQITVREWDVMRAYCNTSIVLTKTYGENVPRFAWQTECKGCAKRQQVGGENYCLDEKCFAEKQESAKPAPRKTAGGENAKTTKPTGPTKINPKKVDDAGVVNVSGLGAGRYEFLEFARFTPAVHCTGCEFNKLAREHKNDTPQPCCFNVPHFSELERNSSREEGVAQWLDERLLPAVLAKLTGNFDLQFQLVAWMALDAPTHTPDGNRVEGFLSAEQRTVRRQLTLRTPGDVITACEAGTLDAEAIAAAGVRAMMRDRGHFYAFARYLGIALTPALARMDEDYVALKRKGELIALIEIAFPGEQNAALLAKLGKEKLDAIVAFCLSADLIAAIGVPPDAKALYEKLQPRIIPEAEDEEADDINEDDMAEATPEATDAGTD